MIERNNVWDMSKQHDQSYKWEARRDSDAFVGDVGVEGPLPELQISNIVTLYFTMIAYLYFLFAFPAASLLNGFDVPYILAAWIYSFTT